MRQNGINILAFYSDLAHQNHKNWWSFGKPFCLLSPINHLLPFQLIVESDLTAAKIVRFEDGSETDILNNILASGGYIEDATDYKIFIYPGTAPLGVNLEQGFYYLELTFGTDTFYSEVFNMSDVSDTIKIQYWHNEPILFKGGHVAYQPPYKTTLYINSDIAKPTYGYEERVIERDGKNFAVQQISYKLNRFTMLAPEYLIDALRIAGLHDCMEITYKNVVYEVDEFLMGSADWQTEGSLAALEIEFKTNTVIITTGRGEKKKYDVVDGGCIPVNFSANDQIKYFGGAYFFGGTLDEYTVMDTGTRMFLQKWVPGWGDVTLTDGQTVYVETRNAYYFWDSAKNTLTKPYIQVDNGIVTGRTFQNTIVEVWLEKMSGEAIKVATGTSFDLQGAGIPFEHINGYTYVKIVAVSANCLAFAESDLVQYTPNCVPGQFDFVNNTFLVGQVVDLENALINAEPGGVFYYKYDYERTGIILAEWTQINDPANFIIPDPGTISFMYFIQKTEFSSCFVLATRDVLAECGAGLAYGNGECITYADGVNIEYSN